MRGQLKKERQDNHHFGLPKARASVGYVRLDIVAACQVGSGRMPGMARVSRVFPAPGLPVISVLDKKPSTFRLILRWIKRQHTGNFRANYAIIALKKSAFYSHVEGHDQNPVSGANIHCHGVEKTA